MKKCMMAALALLATSGAAMADDKFDVVLKNRATMVAAVATLLSLPPNCTVDHKIPDGDQVARFVYANGHRDADAFAAEVKAKMKATEEGMKGEQYQKFTDTEKKQLAEMTCAYGVLLSAKVRDAQK